MLQQLKCDLLCPFVSQTLAPTHDNPNKDLPFLMGPIEAGKLSPVVDKSYPLEEAAEAMQYLEAGHERREERKQKSQSGAPSK